MLIPKEVAQSIVQETEKIMDRNINFMDEEARIIASLDVGRVGDYHAGAADVLKTERPVIISSENTYQGAKPGINLPVRLHEQIVGVIGITGNPADVKQLGDLLKRMTEILIKEAYLDEQVELENQARETFVNEWIRNSFQDEKLFASRGWMFGINIHKPRVAVLLEMVGFQEYWYRKIGQSKGNVQEEVNLQRYRRDLEKLISMHFPDDHEHVLIPDGSSRYTMLLAVNETSESFQQKDRITARIDEIQQALKSKYEQESVAGIGSICINPGFMWKSVDEADRALRFGVDYSRSLFYYEDLGVESFMYDVPESIREDFIKRKLNPALLEKIPECIDTLEAFYKEEGSIKATAETLHIHKNTLQYRLKKVKDLTGFDPRDINDSSLLQIALAFHKIT
ncbi:hypothetical protein GLV98_07160 [Halobacillus litoralis]|uniref:Carbohydrate diacid regulator n=1 Tax=Halobacillus litoralis TaxID=45668 RepID=A0A845E0K0_9BACI|nr:sugar diacid recognition domain-containing protein [Halobacillus litoralis]MYL49257.1 hypothetical protein [Halobacillus litoralis]